VLLSTRLRPFSYPPAFERNPSRWRSDRRPPSVGSPTLLLVGALHQRIGRLVDRALAADGVEPADYALLSLIGVRGPSG
jgi:hypothetical protein